MAADSSKRAPPAIPTAPTAPAAPAAQQAKAARSHQFITARNEKEPPPVVREVDTQPGQHHDKQDARPAQLPAHSAHPTHASPIAAGSSRIGAGRDALGLRVNEIPQGPR